jgi:DNA-binding NarL/FixJ family response regulator
MPVMDGVEATRAIKKRWSRMRVVILTLYEERREESLAAGADGFLVKGCPPEELFRVLKNQRKDKNVRKS